MAVVLATDETIATVPVKVAVALPIVTRTLGRAALRSFVRWVAVEGTGGVALATRGAVVRVGHLTLQPGAVVGDAGIRTRLLRNLESNYPYNLISK